MPLSKETHHLTLEADADLDIGETKKTPAFYAEAFKKAVGEPDWVPQDIDMDDDKDAGVNGFTCSEDSYNKIEMDRKEKFFKEQVEKRKAELDAKYGALKRMDFIPGKK